MAQDPRDESLAHYRCLTKTFIAPERMEEGEDFWIPSEWEPGVHVEPLNELAQMAMKAFLDAHPNKANSLNPLEDLPNTAAGFQRGEGPQVEDTSKVLTLAEASTARPEPGLTGGGKAAKAAS